MYSRQCTSFAAFRLSGVNGFEIPAAYGNANEWGHRARREGYRVIIDQRLALLLGLLQELMVMLLGCQM